jgi:putative two-component system response regulator
MGERLAGSGPDEATSGPGYGSGAARPESPAALIDDLHLRQQPVLIVDDQPDNVLLISLILSGAGYVNLHTTTDSRQVTTLVGHVQPSLLLLDLHMPAPDGFAVMTALQQRGTRRGYLPILVLTADVNPETRRRALASGAHDFLSKPFDAVEVRLRVANLLRTHALYAALQQQNVSLEEMVRHRTQELEQSRLETLEALALAAEFRDDQTGAHSQRVGRLAAAIARTLGLPDEQVNLLRRAAPLHDVGKIGIPDHILLKAGQLTPAEIVSMREHTTIGYDILSPFQSSMLRTARDVALTHHERWDGHGYPQRLAGERIPLEGRIVAVADAFDAMTHERPYQPAREPALVVRELHAGAGAQFDPAIVNAFQNVLDVTGVNAWL